VTDIRFENHGSVVLIRPLTREGRLWVDRHVQAEGWAHIGGAIASDPRHALDVQLGAEEDGLSTEVI
jgi:hypothetical protein